MMVKFKYSLNDLESWKIVDFSRRKKGRPSSTSGVGPVILYPEGRGLTEAKLKNLKQLLPYIPSVYTAFSIILHPRMEIMEMRFLFLKSSRRMMKPMPKVFSAKEM
ncbi:hypothetical protein ANN_17608 [Periplaneta americana]|uniref:Uncharacterized protein n=1 Tax=Periplaneta americana TaxID=6978 RepID=A0ABQ8SUF3_PERAM|nr:hypothetical protein ANN_17608 [Periplaneta americana]